jgi:hypothetical protein
MAAFGAGDQVSGQGQTANLPNFVGELFKLSPLETSFLSLIGGLTGGVSQTRPIETWQDSLHRAPAIQTNAEGADATYASQKRAERRNVSTIHQYGVELSYTKQAATGLTGLGAWSATAPPTADAGVSAAGILGGSQPVMSEMAWQLQIKLEQAALDVELLFLEGTFAYANTGDDRQTDGIVTIVDAATTTDYTAAPATTAGRAVINDLSKKLYDNGAPMRNCVMFVGSQSKLDIGDDYMNGPSGNSWNVQPRSYSVFGVNVTDIETEFGKYPIVLNRHLDVNTVLIADLSVIAPFFMPIPGNGHFFLEPLAKLGSYDRAQLYGEVGLKYGPSGWHAKAIALNTP